jgi:segregation and condensation protein B
MTAPAPAATLSVAEAAALLGRHRTRIYALVRSGDLVAIPDPAGDQDLLRLDRSSVERWAVAGGSRGGPLTPRNAWALIGLASGDAALSAHCLGLLERREEVSRSRTRLARDGLLALAPRLRRRAALTVVHVPSAVFVELERDASLVLTGASAAGPYGWTELSQTQTEGTAAWALDAYVPQTALGVLLDRVPASSGPDTRPVLLRAIDGLWPFPAHCQLAPQPLAALDLLDYPDAQWQLRGRELLRALAEVQPTTVARRTARARTLHGPLVGKTLGSATRRGPRPLVEGDPRTETRAAAANIVGVLWATASQGATVKELRGATGMTRERLEAAYDYLLENPPLGLAVQRQGDEFFLVTAPEVSAAVERHLEQPRPVALSRAALEVLAIVAYKQPIARSGIELIRGANSDSSLETLITRGLVGVNEARLFFTTRAFLDFASLRDLADLPSLEGGATQDRPAVS